jgi:hypothetical protein
MEGEGLQVAITQTHGHYFDPALQMTNWELGLLKSHSWKGWGEGVAGAGSPERRVVVDVTLIKINFQNYISEICSALVTLSFLICTLKAILSLFSNLKYL